MEIIVNGEARQLPEPSTAATLVEALGLTGRRLAMEVNGELLPRSRFDTYRFNAGDRIEIVQAIGGG
ncbi:sulfur carrier protein ThiS [Ectothiorhodospira lacustris]|uniref:sulfur carrier protein ThiS n=1 Tax=Ectothiorhodospira lacustris TaxID=2899127 RepID=UPI001EE7BE55|nr:sulfur carrier protein ThiS [Ectothiorhodospira lacustris]MCG5501950.1 sulfur carrier protein ThiS [Ectothiorhodospira lacustris]MCG5509659.1 sulfur carrier protein ThiS [Ectothiorhodospira lacustris]MCG5523108.1 sulfur carrier protein ThiS [Ectothiorhodospira lacustris]